MDNTKSFTTDAVFHTWGSALAQLSRQCLAELMCREDLLKRRQFIALSGVTMAWPLLTSAQQAAKIPRIGYLGASLRIDRHLLEAFLERLRELGYVNGRNVLIEYRDADGQLDQLPRLAAELVRLDLDLIFSSR